MKKNILQNIISPDKKSDLAHNEIKKNEQSEVDNLFLNLYEQILENSRDVLYCIHYPDFNIEYISPSIFDIIGKTREEVIGTTPDKLIELLHPDDKKLFLDHYKNPEKLRTQKRQILMYRLKPPKGIYRWISDNHTLVFDPGNNSMKLIGSLHDVTDQKLTEDALKRSRDRLYMAIEATNDGMWDWRIDTNEVYFDQRFYTMLGYEPNEFKGSFQEWMKRIHPDDLKSVQNQLEKHLEGKLTHWTIEYRFKARDNNWVWILNRGKVFDRDENDKPLRMVGTHSDISFRKKAEISLRQKNNELLNVEQNLKATNTELHKLNEDFQIRNNELQKIYEQLQISEERFRQLAENTQDVFWLRDEEKILYINSAFHKIWGRNLEQVINNPSILMDWVHPSDRNNFNTWFSIPQLNANDNYIEKYRIIKPSGEIRWIWARMFPIINSEGKVYRIAGIATDITELKVIEDELIDAKEKAMESDRLKSAFLANISHEIRTPMNGIIGFASLLKERVLSIEKRDQYIDIITQSSKALLHIIEDLVDISKLEANQLQISKSDVNLNNLLNQLYDHFDIEKQLYGKNHIQLIKEINSSKPDPILYTDESRLHQILNNLISNAFKFTDKGIIKFGYTITSLNNIELFVSDTGIGISDDIKPHIFKRFRQQETSYSRRFGGTGLGLSICEGLINLLGGSITFDSAKELGTTFYIHLPFSNTNETAETPILKSDFSDTYYWPNKTILVVEDDPVNLEFFKTVLNSTGVRTLLSITGEDAVNICLSEKNIDLILLDIRLPHMNGYAAFSKIKEILPNIPIIAQTAFALAEDAIECIELGFSDYIAKPVNRKTLLTKINYFFVKK